MNATPSEPTYFLTMPTKEKLRAARGVSHEKAASVAQPRDRNERTAIPPTADGWKGVSRDQWILCGLLMVVTLGVYFRATTNPFVNYDDQDYVVDNPHVQQGLTEATLRWAFTTTDAHNWHPLTWLSHALDCQLFGLKPAGHHASSILLHALNTGLLFLLLVCATGMSGRSLLVAALFALHPLNVESVAWVAERKTLLSMFFLLLTLAVYGWQARKPGLGRYLVVALLFALGLSAKPMVVTLPFALLLLDFWPLQRVRGLPASSAFPVPQYPLGRLAVEKLPLMLLAAASSAITMMAQRGVISYNQDLPLLARFFNAIYAYSAYVTKALWPAHLALFYPYEGMRMNGWQFGFSLVVLGGGSYWVWRTRRRIYPVVGWLWFLGTLVPMIGIVQVGNQAMADRYAYLPLIGLFCVVVWGAADFMRSRQLPLRPIAIVAGLLLLALSGWTWRQIGFWSSSLDLWSHALRVTQDNFMAENYVGSAILLQTYQTTGKRTSEEAMAHFENAMRINPRDPIAHLNVGADLHEHGRFQEALEQYELVLGLTEDPQLLMKALINLGAVSQQLGNYAAAKQYYLQVLKLDPGNQTVFMTMGKLGMEERIQELSASAALHPSRDQYFQLGQLQQAAGHVPDARVSFEAALKLDPRFSAARDALSGLKP